MEDTSRRRTATSEIILFLKFIILQYEYKVILNFQMHLLRFAHRWKLPNVDDYDIVDRIFRMVILQSQYFMFVFPAANHLPPGLQFHTLRFGQSLQLGHVREGYCKDYQSESLLWLKKKTIFNLVSCRCK